MSSACRQSSGMRRSEAARKSRLSNPALYSRRRSSTQHINRRLSPSAHSRLELLHQQRHDRIVHLHKAQDDPTDDARVSHPAPLATSGIVWNRRPQGQEQPHTLLHQFTHRKRFTNAPASTARSSHQPQPPLSLAGSALGFHAYHNRDKTVWRLHIADQISADMSRMWKLLSRKNFSCIGLHRPASLSRTLFEAL